MITGNAKKQNTGKQRYN